MATASNTRQTNDAGSTDERRRDGQRTVTPTRTRLRWPAAVSQVGSRRAERGGSDGNGPVTPRRGRRIDASWPMRMPGLPRPRCRYDTRRSLARVR
jgi:hypothetical protein